MKQSSFPAKGWFGGKVKKIKAAIVRRASAAPKEAMSPEANPAQPGPILSPNSSHPVVSSNSPLNPLPDPNDPGDIPITPDPAVVERILHVDIFTPILIHLAKSKQFATLASVARSSRSFNELAIPLIYTDLHLDSVGALERLSEALARALPGAVKPNTPRASLMANLELAKKITLGDLPHDDTTDFALSSLHIHNVRGRHILCPNAKLLQIYPLRPYTSYPRAPPYPEEEDEDSGPFPLGFDRYLSHLCRPAHVCFKDVFGPYEERRAYLETSSHPFMDLLLLHLRSKPWPASTELSWHGPLNRRYDQNFPHPGYPNPCAQPFDLIRLYLPPSLDASSELVLIDGFPRSCAEVWVGTVICTVSPYAFRQQSGISLPSYVINIEASPGLSAGTRLRYTAPPLCGRGRPEHIPLWTFMAMYYSSSRAISQEVDAGARGGSEYEADSGTGLEKVSTADLLVLAQEVVDEEAARTPMNEQQVSEELALEQASLRDNGYIAWDIEMGKDGCEILNRAEVEIGVNQVPCPVCTYSPY